MFARGRPAVRLQEADGTPIQTEMQWDETTGLSFVLETGSYLEASTDYVLVLQDCQQTQEIAFTTSALGEPLEEPAT